MLPSPGDGADADMICRFLADKFDVPCSYVFGGVDADEIMTGGDDGAWCAANCDNSDYAACWRRFFELWKGRQPGAGEQSI